MSLPNDSGEYICFNLKDLNAELNKLSSAVDGHRTSSESLDMGGSDSDGSEYDSRRSSRKPKQDQPARHKSKAKKSTKSRAKTASPERAGSTCQCDVRCLKGPQRDGSSLHCCQWQRSVQRERDRSSSPEDASQSSLPAKHKRDRREYRGSRPSSARKAREEELSEEDVEEEEESAEELTCPVTKPPAKTKHRGKTTYKLACGKRSKTSDSSDSLDEEEIDELPSEESFPARKEKSRSKPKAPRPGKKLHRKERQSDSEDSLTSGERSPQPTRSGGKTSGKTLKSRKLDASGKDYDRKMVTGKQKKYHYSPKNREGNCKVPQSRSPDDLEDSDSEESLPSVKPKDSLDRGKRSNRDKTRREEDSIESLEVRSSKSNKNREASRRSKEQRPESKSEGKRDWSRQRKTAGQLRSASPRIQCDCKVNKGKRGECTQIQCDCDVASDTSVDREDRQPNKTRGGKYDARHGGTSREDKQALAWRKTPSDTRRTSKKPPSRREPDSDGEREAPRGSSKRPVSRRESGGGRELHRGTRSKSSIPARERDSGGERETHRGSSKRPASGRDTGGERELQRSGRSKSSLTGRGNSVRAKHTRGCEYQEHLISVKPSKFSVLDHSLKEINIVTMCPKNNDEVRHTGTNISRDRLFSKRSSHDKPLCQHCKNKTGTSTTASSPLHRNSKTEKQALQQLDQHITLYTAARSTSSTRNNRSKSPERQEEGGKGKCVEASIRLSAHALSTLAKYAQQQTAGEGSEK
ncbi:serine/arginine repetitive matrix protein 2-like isoform X1 [Diaphorina citri]|uniref:Serine/arginine repetitive matrix protein 2-like isoform X1 n=1 Tax=Diaphorina citri TaxID=121845 RepID=A0A1S3D794_DIACI|nr:serine/arginine repetitive matrix protein 2-like isoform X1 [Diaphorina citri]